MNPPRPPKQGPSFWLSLPAVFLLALPFATLAGITPWRGFQFQEGDGAAVWVSVAYGAVSLMCVAALGLPAAYWLARSQSRWRSAAEALVMLALLTPPLAMGIVLISVFGPYTTLGGLLDRIGITLSNNAGAFILSQIYGGIAYFILSAKAAFEGVPSVFAEAAQGLGASDWGVFLRISLPNAWRGVAIGLMLAWGRMIGEFGIVTIFAYFPQGIPVRLYVNLQDEGVQAVYTLLWLMLCVCVPLPLLGVFVLRRSRGAGLDAPPGTSQ